MIALRRRLDAGREEGFTLVELLIAMIVLTIGILALVAAYTSGYVALNRATRVSSAEVLTDSQMERFRALSYTSIQLNRTCGASCAEDSTYTSDAVYSSTAEISGCSSTTYRMDTYIKYSCVSGTLVTSPSLTCGANQPSPVKLVTIVVKASAASTGIGTSTPVSVREQSAFTSLEGQ